MDIIDVFLLSLMLAFGFSIGYRLDWLTVTTGAILMFLYFYPTIRSWFL